MRDYERTWRSFFENVVVPVTGLVMIVLAGAGEAPVPIALYPVFAGMIGYPGFRALDKIRQNGGS